MAGAKRGGFWMTVLSTVIGGIVVAIIVSNFAGPDLKVVQADLYAEKDGHSDFGVQLHNDGSDSVGNCWVYLEGRYSDGSRAGKISTVTSESFHVPANGDAVYPNSDRMPLIFRLNGTGFQGGGKTVLIVQCSGYAKEWTIYDTLLPIF